MLCAFAVNVYRRCLACGTKPVVLTFLILHLNKTWRRLRWRWEGRRRKCARGKGGQWRHKMTLLVFFNKRQHTFHQVQQTLHLRVILPIPAQTHSPNRLLILHDTPNTLHITGNQIRQTQCEKTHKFTRWWDDMGNQLCHTQWGWQREHLFMSAIPLV